MTMRCELIYPCCGKSGNDTPVNAVLLFLREELIYDLKNLGWVEGDVMKTDELNDRYQVQGICEEGNVTRVTRMLDLAFAECVELCYPYSKHDVKIHTSMDDEYSEAEGYRLLLMLPQGFSMTTLELLKNLIHEYMLCRVMVDWFRITHKEQADVWALRLQEAEQGIKERIGAWQKCLTRKSSPW